MTNVYPRRELDQRCRNLSALALLTLAADSAVFGQTASAKVTLGSEYCHPVHFQGGWRPTKGMKQAYQDHFMFGDPYEFRETARSTQEYLVAAVEHGKEYSPNKFWVNLRSGHVRDATQAEWDSAVPVRQVRRANTFYEPTTEKGVLFEGVVFPKSGPQWPIPGEQARVSPDRRLIAVQSWEGQDYRNGNIVAPKSKPGKFFIDLYEVSSGRRFAAIEGVHKGSLRADVPLMLTGWLQSRYFIVQLGSHLEQMLVCEVPEQAEPGKAEK